MGMDVEDLKADNRYNLSKNIKRNCFSPSNSVIFLVVDKCINIFSTD